MHLLDTVAKGGVGFRRLILTVLGGLAEFERELIRARSGAGRKRAQAHGVKFGRPNQRKEAIARMRNGKRRLILRGPTAWMPRRPAGLFGSLKALPSPNVLA